jgi:hypothetical protein
MNGQQKPQNTPPLGVEQYSNSVANLPQWLERRPGWIKKLLDTLLIAFPIALAGAVAGEKMLEKAPGVSYQCGSISRGAKSFIDVDLNNTGSQDVLGFECTIQFLVPSKEFYVLPEDLRPYCSLGSNGFHLSLPKTNTLTRGSNIQLTFVTDGQNMIKSTANGMAIDAFGEARQIIRAEPEHQGFVGFLRQRLGVVVWVLVIGVMVLLALRTVGLARENHELRAHRSMGGLADGPSM